VVEDMTEIYLNVKGIRAKLHVDGPKTVYISTDEGRSGVVTAGDIVHDEEVEIMNPDHVIATLNGAGRLFMELTINKGRGYSTAERNKLVNQPIVCDRRRLDFHAGQEGELYDYQHPCRRAYGL
jgi:DNA-directed RNA polymerase subunit alpha